MSVTRTSIDWLIDSLIAKQPTVQVPNVFHFLFLGVQSFEFFCASLYFFTFIFFFSYLMFTSNICEQLEYKIYLNIFLTASSFEIKKSDELKIWEYGPSLWP